MINGAEPLYFTKFKWLNESGIASVVLMWYSDQAKSVEQMF